MTSFGMLLLVLCWYAVGIASYVYYERKHSDITTHKMLSEGTIVGLAGPITLIAWYATHKPKGSKILFKKRQDKPATIQTPLDFKSEGE